MKNKNEIYYNSTSDSHKIIVEKLYLINSAITAQEYIDNVHSIFNSISKEFTVPFRHIYTVGSAHMGFSIKNGNPFNKGVSDLDVAIVDQHLFNKYMIAILEETSYYQKQHQFQTHNEIINNEYKIYYDFKSYKENLAKGIIHPRYFPIGETKKIWDKFFNEITFKHKSIFEKITACIFLSVEFFRLKQESNIKYFKAQQLRGN